MDWHKILASLGMVAVTVLTVALQAPAVAASPTATMIIQLLVAALTIGGFVATKPLIEKWAVSHRVGMVGAGVATVITLLLQSPQVVDHHWVKPVLETLVYMLAAFGLTSVKSAIAPPMPAIPPTVTPKLKDKD